MTECIPAIDVSDYLLPALPQWALEDSTVQQMVREAAIQRSTRADRQLIHKLVDRARDERMERRMACLRAQTAAHRGGSG